jgi:hypothetical protein
MVLEANRPRTYRATASSFLRLAWNPPPPRPFARSLRPSVSTMPAAQSWR